MPSQLQELAPFQREGEQGGHVHVLQRTSGPQEAVQRELMSMADAFAPKDGLHVPVDLTAGLDWKPSPPNRGGLSIPNRKAVHTHPQLAGGTQSLTGSRHR